MRVRESLSQAAIAATAGLAGVVVGAFVSGHYQLQSQRMIMQQAENAARYEMSRSALQSISESAAVYLTDLSRLVMVGETHGETADVDSLVLRLYRSAFELSLKTTIPTVEKIFAANVFAGELVAVRGDPDSLKVVKARAGIVGETFLAIYADVARYRVASGPGAGRDEVLTSLLQLMMHDAPRSK